MALTPENYTDLKNELENDPKGLGYSGMNDIETADKLNEYGASNEKIGREQVDGQEANKCIDISEYKALSAAERDAWTTVISAGTGMIDVDDSRVKTQVMAIWPAGSTTRANLIDLTERDATRGEILFGRGAVVQSWDVGRARVLP